MIAALYCILMFCAYVQEFGFDLEQCILDANELFVWLPLTCNGSFVLGASFVFAGLLRLFLAWVYPVLQRGYRYLSIILLVVVFCASALSWLLVIGFQSTSSEWGVLRRAHEHAQAKGWQGYTLAATMDYGKVRVIVRMPNGRVYMCFVGDWWQDELMYCR